MVLVRAIAFWTALFWALWNWPGETLLGLFVTVIMLALVAIREIEREDAADIARAQGKIH